MSDCVFCEILAGRLERSLCYEDDVAVGLMDIRPMNPGHVLVMPREHIESLGDLDDETGGRLFTVARRISTAIRRSGVRCEGVNLFLADGEAAGQDVFHVHLHVVPRFESDGVRIECDWPPPPSREELDTVASRIRDGY